MTAITGALKRLLRAYPTLNLRIDVKQSQHEADVVLPGLRYEDIDYTGQPDIWRIVDMMNRVEFAAFFQDYPFVDFKSLYRQGIGCYAKAVQVELKKNFYETTTPKAPLDVNMTLAHIGETSFTITSTLSTGGKLVPSVKMKNLYTLQHIQSGLVERVPDWWKKKFAQYIAEDAQKLVVMPPMETPATPFTHSLTVPRIDTDIHARTRCSSYLKYFLDNMSIASCRSYYPKISKSLHELHIKNMKMLYFTASEWGDTLTVESWEDQYQPRTLHCSVSKQTLPVWYGSVVFHMDEEALPDPRDIK